MADGPENEQDRSEPSSLRLPTVWKIEVRVGMMIHMIRKIVTKVTHRVEPSGTDYGRTGRGKGLVLQVSVKLIVVYIYNCGECGQNTGSGTEGPTTERLWLPGRHSEIYPSSQ